MHRAKRENVTEVARAERAVNKELLRDIETIKFREVDKIEKEFEGVSARIRELHEQKIQIIRAPKTRKEILEYSKKSLKARRHDVLVRFLKEHFDMHRISQTDPFDEQQLRRLFEEEKIWRLAVFAISEQDIEEAISMLPDTGISQQEREAQIQEIDREIAELSQTVKEQAQKK